MLYSVFPEFETVGWHLREFKSMARRSHIRLMMDCTYDAMIDAVEEGFPTYYQEEFRRGDTPARGKWFEFTLGFVKLLYARVLLGRRVDYSRALEDVVATPRTQTSHTHTPQIPRRVRPRVSLDVVGGLWEDLAEEKVDRTELIVELDEMMVAVELEQMRLEARGGHRDCSR
ncbi:hypothetical protein R1sor_002936 [Riccia sorocarpa]|uniref:Uncharacterized protein n=1 Tax=Riccia sorocarpa TaxID=122646 RepID=A0ABD3H2Y0_9MARC